MRKSRALAASPAPIRGSLQPAIPHMLTGLPAVYDEARWTGCENKTSRRPLNAVIAITGNIAFLVLPICSAFPAASKPALALEEPDWQRGRDRHHAQRHRITKRPIEFGNALEVHAVDRAIKVGGMRTTETTEKSLMMAFCSILMSPRDAFSKKLTCPEM